MEGFLQTPSGQIITVSPPLGLHVLQQFISIGAFCAGLYRDLSAGVNLVTNVANDSSQRHPALSRYAFWLRHIWEHANLLSSGRVPDLRCDFDESSQIQVKYNNEPLPILNTYPIQVDSPRSSVTLLLELVGVVEYHFYPPKDIRHWLKDHLTATNTLVVKMPAASWGVGRFSELDVFGALCDELIAATLGVEAPSNTLTYEMLKHLRQGLTMPFVRNINDSRAEQLTIRPGAYDQTRNLFIYDKSAPPGILLSEQDPQCSRLGILVWDMNDKSTYSSHTIVINIQGAYQTPFRLDPAILRAIEQCLQQ